MRTGLLFILAGIILQCIDIPIDFDTITINLGSDILSYLLIIAGLTRFIKSENLQFRTCIKYSIAGLISESIYRLSTAADFGESSTTINLVLLGLTTYIFLKFIYNFTEAMVFQSNFLKIELPKNNIKGAISVFCIVLVGYYVVQVFYNYLSLYANILLLISALYYSAEMYNIVNILYPATPTKNYD